MPTIVAVNTVGKYLLGLSTVACPRGLAKNGESRSGGGVKTHLYRFRTDGTKVKITYAFLI
jgi:hypothetical protein